jgi:hypothetical protein
MFSAMVRSSMQDPYPMELDLHVGLVGTRIHADVGPLDVCSREPGLPCHQVWLFGDAAGIQEI